MSFLFRLPGYRDVLDLIHTSYRHIPISKNSILQLHKNLYKYSQGAHAGRWKQVDNVIEEIDSLGNRRVRFTTTPALEVDQSIEQLCATYNAAITRGTEPLVAIFGLSPKSSLVAIISSKYFGYSELVLSDKK